MKWDYAVGQDHVQVEQVNSGSEVIGVVASIPLTVPNAEEIAEALVKAHNAHEPLRMLTTEHKDLPTLCEALIDKHGLFEVLVALDLVCGDKAAHIRANAGPGDARLANTWDTASRVIKTAAESASVQVVSP